MFFLVLSGFFQFCQVFSLFFQVLSGFFYVFFPVLSGFFYGFSSFVRFFLWFFNGVFDILHVYVLMFSCFVHLGGGLKPFPKILVNWDSLSQKRLEKMEAQPSHVLFTWVFGPFKTNML